MKKIFIGLITFVLCMFSINATTLQERIDSEDTVVLDSNYSEKETVIGKDRKVTLDLNGYTLTGYIKVLGELTVKSSKEGGVIDGTTDSIKDSIIDVDGGKFTLESGTLKNTTAYGLYALNNGTIIINGGEVTSAFSPISGNNTTGFMNFTINGGTITAQGGPAIYMPGPVSLTVTGGTLNGGIGIRMGIINISGGEINATSNIDDPKEYYKYSGNAFLPDALHVYGGTYESQSDDVSNELELNITGGRFVTNNGVGSAIAIYDLGKTKQEMNINISGDATLLTNSLNRNAYDVLSLSDIGVTSPAAGYGSSEYTGKVNTKIIGGFFSSSVLSFLDEEHTETESSGLFIVSDIDINAKGPVLDTTKEVTEPTLGILNNDDIKDVLKESLKNEKIDLTGVRNPKVEIVVDKKSEEEVNEKDLNNIKSLIDKADITLTNYFDIKVNVVNEENNEVLGNIDELTDKVKFTILLDEELLNVKDGYTRKYFIITSHDGKASYIDASIDGNKLTFSTDKFSTYVLGYSDTKNSEINPQTFDGISTYVVLGVISMISVLVISLKLKNRFN